MKDDQVQLLIEAALVGERHEYRRTKPGGMDQLFEVIDIAVADSDKRAIFEMTRDLALLPVTAKLGEEDEATLVERLSEYGIFGWLGRDRRIVDAASKMSFLASRQQAIDAMREEMGKDDLSVDELFSRLNAFADEHHVQLYTKLTMNGLAIFCLWLLALKRMPKFNRRLSAQPCRGQPRPVVSSVQIVVGLISASKPFLTRKYGRSLYPEIIWQLRLYDLVIHVGDYLST